MPKVGAMPRKVAEDREDADASLLIARLRKDFCANQPLIPKSVVDQIVSGENALRVLREWRAVTTRHLSTKANISRDCISDIETGRRKGTATVLKKIAAALNVPFDLLV